MPFAAIRRISEPSECFEFLKFYFISRLPYWNNLNLHRCQIVTILFNEVSECQQQNNLGRPLSSRPLATFCHLRTHPLGLNSAWNPTDLSHKNYPRSGLEWPIGSKYTLCISTFQRSVRHLCPFPFHKEPFLSLEKKVVDAITPVALTNPHHHGPLRIFAFQSRRHCG